ncbi:MAG: LTA synthase family protein [bacterium]|nr:LTA synthase family protein [bacterium]
MFEKKDVLGPHFNQFNKSPNIVFIIVEGLNDDFINDYHGIEWMPFLNELSSKSLYWNHCLTLGERSFAAVPSLIGSLPFGEKGFTLLNRYPLHQTLPSILKSNGYYTTFYYGQGAWFHQKDLFFKYNNLDLIFDNTCFHPKYSKIIVGSDQFFWGYNDKDLFSQSLEVIDTLSAKKRLDIYFTGSSHNPFVISNKLGYQEKYRALVKLKSNKDEKQFFKTYEKYLITLPFVDDAFKDLFSNYRKREDFQNTIFIITGDHPMTEVPIANSLKRYHVPLLIYSPKLKSAKVFTEVVSHLDVFETLLSYLDNYQIKIPKTSTALGGSLIVGEKMAEKKLAFMNDNREVVDYLKGDYYLTDDKLFKVSKGFEILPIEDKFIKNGMLAELLNYNKTRLYVSLKDALLPVLNFYQNHGFQNIKIFDSIMDIMGSNQYFDLIKELPIKNEKFHIHVSFDYEIPLGNNVQLIYQINSNKDSTIKWNSEGISPESAQYQHQFEIAKLPIDQNSLKLKLFIWNEKKEKIILKNFKILVYR